MISDTLAIERPPEAAGMHQARKRFVRAHDTIRALQEMILATEPSSSLRPHLWFRLKSTQLAHRVDEERLFERIALPMDGRWHDRHLERHHQGESYAQVLDVIAFDTPRWMDTFRRLAALDQRHMEREERVLFPQLERQAVRTNPRPRSPVARTLCERRLRRLERNAHTGVDASVFARRNLTDVRRLAAQSGIDPRGLSRSDLIALLRAQLKAGAVANEPRISR